MAADPIGSLPAGFSLDSQAPASSAPPDGFQLDAAPPVHPALAGLPQPHEAAAQADLNAQQVIDRLESVGHQMEQNAIPPALKPSPTMALPAPEGATGASATKNVQVGALPSGPIPEGLGQIGEGAEQIAGAPITAAQQPGTKQSDVIAGGLHKILGGGMEASSFAIPAGLVAAPVAGLAGLGAGTLAGTGTTAGLEKLGVSQPKAEVAGDVAGLAAGGLAGHAARAKPGLTPDNVLAPERAAMDRQVAQPPSGSSASRATVDVSAEPPAGFMMDAPEPPAGFEVDKTEGVTNDNRNDVPMGRSGERTSRQEQQGEQVAPQSETKPAERVERPAGEPEPSERSSSSAKASASAQSLEAKSEDQQQVLKPLHEMNPDELDQVIQRRTGDERDLLANLFGEDGAKKYQRLERVANGSSSNAAAAGNELQDMEGSLTPEQRNRLYGIDQPEEHDLDRAKSIRSAIGRLDTTSPEALGDSLKWALSRFDPEHPDKDPEAYAQLRHGMEVAQDRGWDTGRISKAAIKGVAGRFSDPEDARFVLSKFGPQGKVTPAAAALAPRPPSTPPAYGANVDVNVPGESTLYPARYAVRELSDVQASHNPVTFQANPQYEYENDRDYSNPQNAARVVDYGSNGNYKPDYVLTKSPTAELGAPIIDQRGNVLGGNNRTMTLGRVYGNNPQGADDYRQQLAQTAQEFGVAPADLARFKNPILTRELTEPITNGTAQRAITDFNKSGVGSLTPGEQAVTDGRRMSAATVQHISGNLADVGEDSTLAQAMQGDRGQEIVQALVKDGVITEQEKNGYLDERDFLTPDAKQRIAKALVGRLFDTPADFNHTAPEVRNKIEKVVPQVLRVEDRPAWSLTQPVREGIAALADARAHGIRPDDLASQPDLTGAMANHSPQALAIAQTLAQGPIKAAKAFRQYANDAELSKEGAPSTFFEPPTQKEAFEAAFNGGAQKPVEMQAHREEKVPTLADASRERPHVKGAPNTFHGRLARLDRIPLSPENAARANAFVANTHSLELIGRMAGRQPDWTVGIGAIHINPQSAGALARRLQGLLGEYPAARRPAGLQQLISAARNSAAGSKSFIVVKDAPGFSETERLTGLNEELNHAAQRVAGGNGELIEHLGDRADALADTSLGTTARMNLQGRFRYHFRSTGEAAAEIGVRLMDAGRHSELGLNLDQARTLGAQYVRALRKEYGRARSNEIAGRVFDALRRTDSGGQKQSGGVPGSAGEERGAGPPSGAGADTPGAGRLQANPTGAELPGQLRPRQAGLPGIAPPEQGTLFSRKPAAEEPPSGSLFDAAENKDVAETAARDRDQLQGQRLTAQLNAPLSRGAQLDKLKPSKTKPQTNFFEDTTPDQGMLFSRKAKNSDDEAKLNYSGLGALQDKTVRNLSQLAKASTPATEAAYRAASSRSQSSVILKTAMPKIEAALGKDVSPPDFRRALIQSRLQGIRERWQQMADFAGRASDDNLTSSLPNVLGVLENIQDPAGLPRNLADTIASLAEKKDFDSLRKLLGQTFQRAAQNVARIMPQDEFDAARHTPGFQAGLRVYKDLVEKAIAENHALNEGIFSNALGPLNTYYPLVPVEKTDIARAQLGSRQEYSRPKNIANDFATGLAAQYDSSMEGFRERLTQAVHTNNKAALMDALQQQGLVQPLGSFERAGNEITYAGQQYQAVKMETTPARQIIQNGKSTFIPPKSVLVPRWLAHELEPILTRGEKPTIGAIGKIINWANTIAISGPADFVYHSSNLFGALVANTPFLGTSLLGKASSLPLLKRFTAIVKVLSADATSEESAGELQQMAKLGILPDRFGSETFSKKYADQTGATLNRHSLAPMLYGPKGIDVRARLVMYRLAKEIAPGASGPALHMFVNQLGNYTKGLQSAVVRGATGSGLGPFAQAGTSMIANGINAWTGTGPMPKSGIGLRLWQQLTGGGVGLVALWALAYKAYTHKYPWEDKRAKLLQIPANPVDRNSKIGQALWGKGSEVGYINFTFFNPLVARGARALGVKGAADSAMAGGKWWQQLEAAQKDMMNAYAHPFLGPIPRAAFVGLTGNEPYVTGLRDDRARLAPQLMPAVRGGAGASVAKRAGAAAAELNSFYGNVGAALGGFKDNPHDTSNKWVRMVMDLATPGLVGQAQNPYAQRGRVIRQAAEAQRAR